MRAVLGHQSDEGSCQVRSDHDRVRRGRAASDDTGIGMSGLVYALFGYAWGEPLPRICRGAVLVSLVAGVACGAGP